MIEYNIMEFTNLEKIINIFWILINKWSYIDLKYFTDL